MRHPEFVPTDFGPLTGPEAYALIQMTDHDGILALRKLMRRRVDSSLGDLRLASTPPEEAMFERGVLEALSSLDEILLAIRKKYDHASGKESIDDGTQDARSDDDPRDDEPGPG